MPNYTQYPVFTSKGGGGRIGYGGQSKAAQNVTREAFFDDDTTGSSYGGGGFQYKPPTGQTSVSQVKFSGKEPTLGPMPSFNLPEYDEREVEKLSQRHAAPGMRKLRDTVRGIQRETYDNPNVRALTLRQALSGYGLGLSQVLSGARKTAGAEYGARRREDIGAQTMKYQTDVNTMMAQYSAAWNKYLSSATRTTTSQNQYTPAKKKSSGETRWIPGIGYTTQEAMGR